MQLWPQHSSNVPQQKCTTKVCRLQQYSFCSSIIFLCLYWLKISWVGNLSKPSSLRQCVWLEGEWHHPKQLRHKARHSHKQQKTQASRDHCFAFFVVLSLLCRHALKKPTFTKAVYTSYTSALPHRYVLCNGWSPALKIFNMSKMILMNFVSCYWLYLITGLDCGLDYRTKLMDWITGSTFQLSYLSSSTNFRRVDRSYVCSSK